MLSELFFQNWIHNGTTKELITTRIRKYLENNKATYDNHKLPQVKFLLDSRKTLWKGVDILHLETIDKDLAQIGFNDFNYHTSSKTKFTHEKYFNGESYELINHYYSQDFITFGYDMITPVVVNTTTTAQSSLRNRRLLSTNPYGTHVYNESRITLYFCIFGLLMGISVMIFRFRKY